MDPDPRYYWRRVSEEMAAAVRSVTPAARSRHEFLVRLFNGKLKELDAPCPFTDEEIESAFGQAAENHARMPEFI